MHIETTVDWILVYILVGVDTEDEMEVESNYSLIMNNEWSFLLEYWSEF